MNAVNPDAVPAARVSAVEAAARLARHLEAARVAPLTPSTMSVDRGEALIAEIRSGRDRRSARAPMRT